MSPIQALTTDLYQQQQVPLPDGSVFTWQIRFVSQQYGWYIQSLTYANFTLEGFRIFNSPNMLHQFRNQIPFGVGCFSTGDREPSLQQDFASAASVLYLLSAAEVAQFTEFLENA